MKILEIYRRYKKQQAYYNRDARFIKLHNLSKITNQELTEIRQVWPMLHIRRCDLIYSMMYKQLYGFDPYFLNDFQYYQILKKTNPHDQVVSLEHKAMADIYFHELPLPKVYLRRIAGSFYDDKMNILTFEKAIELLSTYNQFVIKPAISTGCGKGVKLVRIMPNIEKKKYIVNIVMNYGNDFVVQEVLRQLPEMARLNPTSVNSCRITSILINGKFGYSTVLKIGKKGSEIDNWNSSYLIGVNADGTLQNFGFDHDLNKITKTDSGFIFGGMKIPHYENMIQLVKNFHPKYFPTCGIVGWDIFIDDNENVRIIEVNLQYPGCVGEQLCSGTFFKDFRNDICALMR